MRIDDVARSLAPPVHVSLRTDPYAPSCRLAPLKTLSPVFGSLFLLAACGPGLTPPPGAAPGQPCSADAASLHPVQPERVLDLDAVSTALAGVEAPGEAGFSVRLMDPENFEVSRLDLSPTTVTTPVLELGGTLDDAVTRALAEALAEGRARWVEGEVPRTFRVELRTGPLEGEGPRVRIGPSVGCLPAIVDRTLLARSLEGVALESATSAVNTTATLLVEATGRVIDVRFDEAGDRFDGRVRLERVLRETRFHPGIRDGIAVSAWVSLPIELRPRRGRPI